MSAHAWAFCAIALAACGGMVEASPDVAPVPVDTRAYYLDDTCAARPAAVSWGGADIVTIEPGWHYDGSDPKVRTFDASQPSDARRVCWRADVGDPCPCRELTPGETVFAVPR